MYCLGWGLVHSPIAQLCNLSVQRLNSLSYLDSLYLDDNRYRHNSIHRYPYAAVNPGRGHRTTRRSSVRRRRAANRRSVRRDHGHFRGQRFNSHRSGGRSTSGTRRCGVRQRSKYADVVVDGGQRSGM